MTASESSGELVEIFTRFVLTLPQSQFQRRPITRCVRQFAGQRPYYFIYSRQRTVSIAALGRPIVNIFSRAPIIHHAGPFQLREMTRNTGLAHAQNLLQFRNRKLFLLEQEKQTKPRW